MDTIEINSVKPFTSLHAGPDDYQLATIRERNMFKDRYNYKSKPDSRGVRWLESKTPAFETTLVWAKVIGDITQIIRISNDGDWSGIYERVPTTPAINLI